MAEKRTLTESNARCRDYLLACIPLVGLSIYLYGFRPLVMVAIALAVALLCDLLNALLRSQSLDALDLSSYMFAVVLTLMLPAAASYYVVIVAVFVAVMLGKHAFGGYECSPFSPPAFGFAFVSVCFGEQVFKYSLPFERLSLGMSGGAALYDAPAHSLKYGGIPYVETSDLVLGNFAGPMGATFCLIILAAMFLLIERKTITGHIGISFLLTCAAISFLFPRVQATRLMSVMYEMLSGCLVFAAVFLASEPSISPKNPLPKVVYGVILGGMTMIMRFYGAFEMGFCFAILLVSPLSGWLDRRLTVKKKQKPQPPEQTEVAADE